MQPDPAAILKVLSITEPLIGLYDAPDPEPFAPLVEPADVEECVFASYERWREGKTLHITREKHGCGAGHLLGVASWSREEAIDFLFGEEGLRASYELMNQWLDSAPGYEPRHEHVLIGPLHAGQYAYLRSVTFYANADQLAVLVTGSSFYSRPADPPVTAPFSSGCGQLAAAIGDLESPRAVIGSTDQAMRRFLPRGVLAFTVTKPMFELLCRWADDPASSLHNDFLGECLAARGGSF